MTMEQLKQYNGTGPEGRVLVAVNGKIFDVTKGMQSVTMLVCWVNIGLVCQTSCSLFYI